MLWLAPATLLEGCADDPDCPAGTLAFARRCVAEGRGDAGQGDAAPDCDVGEGVGAACTEDAECPCGPCAEIGGQQVCTSWCNEGQECLAGWACEGSGACGCEPAQESCNLLDDDCDGAIDDDASDAPEWFPDEDGDGFGDAEAPIRACEPPDGALATGGDCDDGSAQRYPAAPEICDGLDDDCDGVVPPDEVDGDEDGSPSCADCADDDPTRYPGAAETCDGRDDDCDGIVPADEADADRDEHRICDGDCADEDATRHPGAAELCNGIDDDCNDAVPGDEVDADDDGFAVCQGDCDDVDDTRYPGAPELCNGVDDDCADGVPIAERDIDGDGFRPCNGDCEEGNPDRHPGAPELCNGVDDDCDGGVPADENDVDADDWRICEGDCMDGNPDVHPDQATYFEDHRGDGSWDYDCDGEERQRYTRSGCTPDLQGCTDNYWCTEVPACGDTAQTASFCLNCVPQCGLDARQPCR